MNLGLELKKAVLTSLWFMILTFPILVIRVNTIENRIEWRWSHMIIIGAGAFFGSFFFRYLMALREKKRGKGPPPFTAPFLSIQAFRNRRFLFFVMPVLLAAIMGFPFLFSMYQTNIMISALIYVMLGLGLNIVVGLAGLLDLGYVAFYAVGAYAYGLLNHHFGLGFWTTLPLAALLSAFTGILLGYPVLRLRGDYLAIVTLGFGEIIRLILENWGEFSQGPSGIANIPRPSLFGMGLSLSQSTIFLYFLMIALVCFTVFVVNRLQHSRIGRAWIALREDEIACQAMGVDRARAKLTAFALGATWAGMGGVIFAAKTTFINPACFTIWESIIVLSMVVLGGMGSIPGVIAGALILSLLPEYLRAFAEYRMLVFGVMLVGMMVFRPGGIIQGLRKTYTFKGSGP
jgi:branched-chain amino acid transport system permease protein